MRLALGLAVVLVFVGGCANTVRIVTVPSGAKVYSSGTYLGTSPVSIRQAGHDAVSLVVEKPGYHTVQRTINYRELQSKYWQGDCTKGSEYGNGYTYVFTIMLEPGN